MKANVQIKTRGKRGGEFSPIKETAQAVIFVDGSSNYISVDSYTGQGETYKTREQSEIAIQIGSFVWKGTASELESILNKKPKSELSEFSNGDLKFDLEKIMDYHHPKLTRKKFDNDGETTYTIEVNDNSYFYTNIEDRDTDFSTLWELLH